MVMRRFVRKAKTADATAQVVDKTGANKGKKKQILFTDPIHNQVVDVDSIEEWYTYAWIVELTQMGLVSDFEYQPESLPLSPRFVYVPYVFPGKKAQKEKFLFHPHVYTADFRFTVFVDTEKALNYFAQVFKIDQSAVRKDPVTGRPVADIWIDVKGTWMRQGEAFSINQKLVFEKHGIYVHKFIPKQAFQKLGCPKLATQTPSGRPSKVFGNMKFLETLLCECGVTEKKS